ncbi:lysophospholipase L1-like esterase [Geothermobacter ehrlichii]|uniref:Lysophospholipase L1-like esterase n=1 Tax=Geothermobacter ehrlichii TaxID=213224 RepID=A0A5D3WLH1_9BACT|nr:arylesterase [Geothermobacter ehrlichii]TYO99287.1 lysophospholipase L1-like esterase [Geothermobacter ehrlichii]
MRALCLLFLLFLAVAGCDRQPAIGPLTAGDRILAFGDSLTHGTGASPEQSYPAVLEQLLGNEVINAGIPGETTAEGLKRLPRLLDRIRPRLVVLIHGGNDFLRRLDPQETRANLQAMIDLCRERGADVVLMGVPRPGLFLSAAPLYEELAKHNHLPLLEDTLSGILADRSLKSDAIHPNATGYRLLARKLAERIRGARN